MKWSMALAGAVCAAAAAAPAGAVAVWTDWSSTTVGAPGAATGTLNGVAVSYSGEVIGGSVTQGTAANIWAPESSFAGGTATPGPAGVGDVIYLRGGYTGTNTISFATPISNPVFAIWSLGQPSQPATFTFGATPVLQAGGANAIFGGSSITVAGNVVSGREGNGVLQFEGTVSSISWTDTPENYYGFTVGTAGSVPTAPIPEPSTWALLGFGMLTLGAARARRRGQ